MAVRVRGDGAWRRGVSPSWVRGRGERMLAALQLRGAELSILLCDDRIMRGLNRRHRRIDRTTDVLSFIGVAAPRERARPAFRVLGDVVISMPTASRQARARRLPVRQHVAELLAHGLLHLIGFDHRSSAELRRMRARTDLLCGAALGRPRRHQ